MVDLGLPSGLKWANKNIGAETETDYGLYFQWGDTVGYYKGEEAKAHSTWSTAPFNNGSSSFYSTYFNAHKSEWLDGAVLKPQYDAATQNMGGNWRMPTKADWNELLSNTTNTWESVNGVSGRRFTASNGNSIFIPASGNARGGSLSGIGSNICVWSSSLNTSYLSNAWNLYAGSSSCNMTYDLRCFGFSLRGVCK